MKRHSGVSHDRLTELLSYDQELGEFRWKPYKRRSRSKPWSLAGCVNCYGYVLIKIDQVKYPAHRLAWFYVHREWPTEDIDHINMVRDDNRITNLRLATRKQNQENRGVQKNNKSGKSGVHFCNTSGKWIARIKHHQKTIRIGSFAKLKDAVSARRAKEKELFTFSPLQLSCHD